jgi:uncharacterized membrane protein (UPF0127 family)
VKNANPVFLYRANRRKFPPLAWLPGLRGTVGRFASVAVLTLAAGLSFAGCGDKKTAAPVAVAAPKTVADFFPIKVGDKTVRLQLAVRTDEMERGLMERRDLGRDEGMIFVYAKPQQMNFWMRNTPTPLDIGFFDGEGMLEEVYTMHPFDEKTVGSRSTLLSFALEMNQGWFGSNAVKPGAQLDLKALAAALRERGFEPAKFGLRE